MIRQRTAFVIAATGIFVAVSVLVMHDAGLLGVQQAISSQANPWDAEFMAKGFIMIFEGTVKSTEIKLVYEPSITQSPEEHESGYKKASDLHMNVTGKVLPRDSWEWPILPNGDRLIRSERHFPYNYVTIQVTEWLKDLTGQYADHVVVRDYTTGVIGKINGTPALFENINAVEYSVGEKAIFFVYYIEDELVTSGAFQVFRYDENGLVYLPHFADIMEPRVADEFKAEIRASLEPLNKTAQNIN